MPIPTTEERLPEGEAHVEGLDGSGSDMGRIVSMSDAVFAFSMTFLVITLVLPQVAATGKYPNLIAYLSGEWSTFVAYLISFFVITSWWAVHRRMFSPIVRYDPLLVRLNNMFLLIIAITPFLVGILYDYGPGPEIGRGSPSTELAVALFAAVQVVGGLLMLAIWRHSTERHQLVEERLPHVWIRRTELMMVYNVAVFAISLPIAFISPFVAMLSWIVMAIGMSHVQRKRRSNLRRTAPPVSASK